MVLHEYGLAHHRCTSVRMHSALVVLRGCEDLSMPILSAPGQIECWIYRSLEVYNDGIGLGLQALLAEHIKGSCSQA